MERDFSNSYVVYNASSLAFSYPFVSVNPLNSVIRSMFRLIDRTPVYRLLWSLSLFYLSFSLSLCLCFGLLTPVRPASFFCAAPRNQTMFPFQLNWSAMLVPREWQGPIIVRSVGYFSQLPQLLDRHSNRVIHNSLILLFVLSALPQSRPSPLSCTKKVMWAMPQASSALYLSQYSMNSTEPLIKRVMERERGLVGSGP